MSFIRDSMSPVRLLSTKCDDALQSEVMVNFSEPGVVESARNKKSMPYGGDSMTLYGVGEASEETGVGGAVAGAGEQATGVDGTVTGVAGVHTMTVDEDVPLAATAVLARPVL